MALDAVGMLDKRPGERRLVSQPEWGMADRLSLTRGSESAGLKGDDAERIVTDIYDAIRYQSRSARVGATARTSYRPIVIWLGALVVTVAGLLFAAL